MRRLLLVVFLATLAAAACGARSGLPIERVPHAGGAGGAGTGGTGGAPPPDAGVDAPADAPADVPPDVPIVGDCAEAGITFIYVITEQNTLWSFYPPTAAFTPIGKIACPGEGNSPFSMGVDRLGIAWVVFQNSGKLYRVDTANAGCTATPYAPNQLGWSTFGMAFVTPADGGADTLFVAESSYSHLSKGLGTIDLSTFELHFVAPLTLPPPPPPAPGSSFAVELTGTGDGRLYGFSLDQPGPGSHVSQIDPTTGAILDTFAIPQVGTSQSSFAFAYWGGSFYLFTADQGLNPTVVTRYDPAAGTVVQVAGLGDSVVGVGVSTCAPE